MTRREPGLEPELEAFLQRRRVEPVLSARARARVLAHARTIIARGTAVSSGPRTELPPSDLFSVSRHRLSARVALLASVAFAAGAIAMVVGLRRHTSPPTPVVPAVLLHDDPSVPTPVPPDPPTRITPQRMRHAGAGRDPFVAELTILQRAQAAFARHDFSSALVALAEHARRFADGRLAEEREALRVRSLLALGRRHEARRAAASFAARFPRSVLLSRLESEASAPP